MRTRFSWMLIFLMALALPMLACNLLTGDPEQPTLAPTVDEALDAGESPDTPQEPVDEGSPEEEPASQLPELGSLQELLEQYNSYRINVEMQFEAEGDQAGSGGVTVETARIVEPPASSMVMRFEGSFSEEFGEATEAATLSVIEIGDTTYTTLPGLGCISGDATGAAAGADEFSDLLDTDQFLGDLQNAQFVGQETVNGVATDHYRFDENDVTFPEEELSQMQGDLYVAREENYIVRLAVEGVGDIGAFDQELPDAGTMRLEYNVLDVGAAFEIEPPEGCGPSESDLPLMEGATDVASFPGFTSYTVDAQFEEVVAFYEEQMVELGYQPGEEQLVFEETALLFFTAEDRSDVTVTITATEGEVSVLVTSGDEGQ